jgi:hypothetical protein
MVCVVAVLFTACGGDEVGGGSSLAGTYQLEKSEELKQGIMVVAGHDAAAGEMTDEQRQQIEAMIDAMTMTMVLKEDGTFTVDGNLAEAFSASGTWKADGTKLTLTTTHENEEEQEEPDVREAVIENGSIRMPKDADTPFDMVLRKQ